MSHAALSDIVASVQGYVRYLQRLGVVALPLQGADPTRRHAADNGGAVEGTNALLAVASLQQLADAVRDCRQCRLHQGRRQVVFGTGNPQADLVFVGEAPGRDEDLQGEPFVGAAGQLLTRIIEAIGLRREQVYLLNVVKCRPPDNRTPLPDEIAACRPLLEAQLAHLRPRVICALGRVAAQALLQTEEAISRLRGRFHYMGDTPVMPTYHPAYLLRNPQGKRAVWKDMQLVQRQLGLG